MMAGKKQDLDSSQYFVVRSRSDSAPTLKLYRWDGGNEPEVWTGEGWALAPIGIIETLDGWGDSYLPNDWERPQIRIDEVELQRLKPEADLPTAEDLEYAAQTHAEFRAWVETVSAKDPGRYPPTFSFWQIWKKDHEERDPNPYIPGNW